MDPRYSAQDILRCDLCETALVQSHCELCHIKLCKACVGEHLSDPSKNHRVVPYKAHTSTPNYPKCPNHVPKLCELFCERCDMSVCTTCVSSEKHHGHKFTDLLQKLSSKTEKLETDLKELEENIYLKYKENHLAVESEKAIIGKHYEKLRSAVINQGKDWHKEIDTIVNKLKAEIDDMKNKHLNALIKQEKEISQTISEIEKRIFDIKKTLESNDIFTVFSYNPKNSDFSKYLPKLKVLLPCFSPQPILRDLIHQKFGSLTELCIATDDDGYTIDTSGTLFSAQSKTLLDRPELITTIDTGYMMKTLISVTCLSQNEICASGSYNIIKLYNQQGTLLKSIKTKSGNDASDIAVTMNGNLVYTDSGKRTINIVKDKQIWEMIRVRGWTPHNICSTSSGELLVAMKKYSTKESKIVRYTGYEETQSIQFDEKGDQLFSYSDNKHLSENRNLDICVADCSAEAVVVVSHAGKLRFRYTGHPSIASGSCKPYGIATDSLGQILTSDCDKNYIHILDRDGTFLHYIDNCVIYHPWGLYVDSEDSLYVAEFSSGKVKKIKYM